MRKFRKVFLYVPRKNGKTTLLAAILLCLFFIDGEAGAEIYNVASTRKQAGICFKIAKQMILQSPLLSKKCHPFKTAIEIPGTGSTYQTLSSDLGGKQHGENPSGVGFDELFAQKNDELYDAMTTGDVARTQPVIVFTTTADLLGRESVCNAELAYARNVRDGVVADPSYLAVIYEIRPDEDWKSEAAHRRVNPNYDVFNQEIFREALDRAINDASKRASFLRFHLNRQPEQSTPWLGIEHWRGCKTKLSRADFRAALLGQECLAGMDLADGQDLNSLALFFPPVPLCGITAAEPVAPSPADSAAPPIAAATAPARAIWRHWAPAEILKESKAKQHVRYYQVWSRNCICRNPGMDARRRVLECPADLHLYPGQVTDNEWIRADVLILAELYRFKEMALDPHQALWMLSRLEQDGLNVFKHLQSCPAMNPGIKEMERLLVGRLFEHDGDPAADWAFQNVVIYQNTNGEKKFDKKRATNKIDPMVALAMPAGRAALNLQAPVPRVIVI